MRSAQRRLGALCRCFRGGSGGINWPGPSPGASRKASAWKMEENLDEAKTLEHYEDHKPSGEHTRESWNGLGCKGPLKVIQTNPPGVSRELDLGEIQIPLRICRKS